MRWGEDSLCAAVEGLAARGDEEGQSDLPGLERCRSRNAPAVYDGLYVGQLARGRGHAASVGPYRGIYTKCHKLICAHLKFQ